MGVGEPDQVYFLEIGGPVVILLWDDPQNPAQPLLSLFELGSGVAGAKSFGPSYQETAVNDNYALWVTSPHPFELRDPLGSQGQVQFVPDNVLIWVDGDVTYRLENDLPMEQAVQIAESLR